MRAPNRRNISMMKHAIAPAILFLAFVSFAFSPAKSVMKLESSAFAPAQAIPQKYTCDGSDVSPELSWSNAPAGTKTFALIADDPDAPRGTWVHWVVYNIPGTTHEIPEGAGKPGTTSIGVQGQNDFGTAGYGGPCPPPGKPHRYFFKLFALDTKLDLKPGATKQDVERAMQSHIQANVELMGTYQRRAR